MRVFTFQPYQLSSMQQGVQATHAVAKLINKYPKDKQLQNWARKGGTLISKNGGTFIDVENIYRLFKQKANSFPFTNFREPDIFNHITCVTIGLPLRIWKYHKALNMFEEELISLLKRTQLAK